MHSFIFGYVVQLVEKNVMKGIMNINLYTCYSLPLRNYLRENGMRYKLAALNPNSKKLFWVYIKTKELDELLGRWSISK